jgi:serine phosphatase RsbU (regulator of sigma subunit)
LIGDQAASQRQAQALSILAAQRSHVPPALTQQFDLLLAHASLIGRKQASVDQLVKQVVDRDVGEQLRTVEREYQRRFDQTVQSSNKYRRILYGWSLGLLVAIGFAGFWLLRLYTSLERRVAERTADLKQALDALWGEMKLARKIQEALVPKAPVGRNCEIAASMRPTDEVGGDYYDVVRARDRDWILIGDVSGHGVPAGLIMMMCHTAVRTVLGADPDISPDRLLSTVNTVLTQNIRQLGEDKYMTISAFRRDPDGTVLFAGAHQDVHIYRADTDHVESLETQGIWLGIREDVRDSLVNQKFHLRPGDLMVLYTDGISEARRGETMFDTTGVNQVLTQAKGKSAEQVLDELFAGLDGYQVTDDATVLVIKQLASDQPDLHVGSVTSAA